MKSLALFFCLAAGYLDAKMFSELENVQGVLRLYTVVDGYHLRPAKAVQFYRDRGNTEAAKIAGEALQLQLDARSIYRRDFYVGSLSLGVLAAVAGGLAWRSPEASASASYAQFTGASFLAGINAGAFIGIIVGAQQGSRLLKKAELKVAEAASAWYRTNPPKYRSRINAGGALLEMAWCF